MTFKSRFDSIKIETSSTAKKSANKGKIQEKIMCSACGRGRRAGGQSGRPPVGGEEPVRPEAGTGGGPGAQQPTQNDTRVANKYTFKCSASPLVREMQLKPEELALQHLRAEQSVRLRMSALRKTGAGVRAAASGRCLVTFKDSEGAVAVPPRVPSLHAAWLEKVTEMHAVTHKEAAPAERWKTWEQPSWEGWKTGEQCLTEGSGARLWPQPGPACSRHIGGRGLEVLAQRGLVSVFLPQKGGVAAAVSRMKDSWGRPQPDPAEHRRRQTRGQALTAAAGPCTPQVRYPEPRLWRAQVLGRGVWGWTVVLMPADGAIPGGSGELLPQLQPLPDHTTPLCALTRERGPDRSPETTCVGRYAEVGAGGFPKPQAGSSMETLVPSRGWPGARGALCFAAGGRVSCLAGSGPHG